METKNGRNGKVKIFDLKDSEEDRILVLGFVIVVVSYILFGLSYLTYIIYLK